MERHIVSSYDQKLAQLRDLVVELGQRAEHQADLALEALSTLDPGAAQRVREAEPHIGELRRRIDDEVVLLLALRAPVADDLRTAVTAIRIAKDLARAADRARNVARRVISLAELPAAPPAQSVVLMGRSVLDLLSRVMAAYRAEDAEQAMAAWHEDKDIDERYSSIFREMLTYMMADSRLLAGASHLIFIAKDLERIGDHATNIGEMVYYQVTGKELPMARPKADTSAALATEMEGGTDETGQKA